MSCLLLVSITSANVVLSDLQSGRGGQAQGREHGTGRSRLGSLEATCHRANHRHDESFPPGEYPRYVTNLRDDQSWWCSLIRVPEGGLDVQLSEEDIKYLEEPYKPVPIHGHF